MNREIKFRTWDAQNKEFSEWTNRDPFFSTSHGNIFFWERNRKEDGSYDGDSVLEDLGGRFILQQFTGMFDKNGKEIYEGDILKVQGWRGSTGVAVVEWREIEASDDAGFNSVGFRRFDEYGEPEVIGNIFQNPELLKK
jgi:uncharacterized phage protein (TIGR01671 family)